MCDGTYSVNFGFLVIHAVELVYSGTSLIRTPLGQKISEVS